ncbi:MAG TPA: phosphoribosylamine--glycine ligase [Candidatus Limnocylindrales bacterium]|nr:phosphoribosylamine--glycine ligase [Candidatus Limnocylindrales bacterium]
MSLLRVLIVGGGGREHVLAWKLAQSPMLDKLFCAPGNAGIASVAECVAISVEDIDALQKWALENKIDLTIIGPEVPLVLGITDIFRQAGLKVFGPDRDGAMLEGSKAWAKEMMRQCSIPTASYAVFSDFAEARQHLVHYHGRPVVIKADGLAAGKGVVVAASIEEAEKALHNIMVDRVFGEAGDRVLIEECLTGEEVSVLAIADGKNFFVLPSAQDHKAIGEGDTGPNTGGMGAYSPAPVLTASLAQRVNNQVFQPLLEELRNRGIDFRGVLYAGLMVSGGQFNVLEFNVRFGDPEAQVIIPRLRSDLLPLLAAAAAGDLSGIKPEWSGDAAVCVVIASGGYPGKYEVGYEIKGLELLSEADSDQEAVFHGGTAFEGDRVVTAGGRVLGVTAWGGDLKIVLQRVYRTAEKIKFSGCYYRCDIAYRALPGGKG